MAERFLKGNRNALKDSKTKLALQVGTWTRDTGV